MFYIKRMITKQFIFNVLIDDFCEGLSEQPLSVAAPDRISDRASAQIQCGGHLTPAAPDRVPHRHGA
jgi:hypothetical protein